MSCTPKYITVYKEICKYWQICASSSQKNLAFMRLVHKLKKLIDDCFKNFQCAFRNRGYWPTM